jgi:hypothetical protein
MVLPVRAVVTSTDERMALLMLAAVAKGLAAARSAIAPVT